MRANPCLEKNLIFLYVLNHFNMFILKNKKNIILIHFNIKIILKNNLNYIPKQASR